VFSGDARLPSPHPTSDLVATALLPMGFPKRRDTCPSNCDPAFDAIFIRESPFLALVLAQIAGCVPLPLARNVWPRAEN
jgi:hypothetical protein